MMADSVAQVIEVADAFCHLSLISLSLSDGIVDSWFSMTDRLISGAGRRKTQIHLFPNQIDGTSVPPVLSFTAHSRIYKPLD